MPRENTKPNFIYISQTMARLHKSDRFVLNGIDPADFIYSETKNNCFLFVVSGGIEKARSKKGLDIAFWIAKENGESNWSLPGASGEIRGMRHLETCAAPTAPSFWVLFMESAS